MVRQYIGARYVPRFLGTYDVTQIYDALDVVDNGAGTSYIARKTVPAGTPLTNTDYWFVYGSASGAINQLQNDMIAAQNDILAIDSDIGDMSTLPTTDQTLAGAITEMYPATEQMIIAEVVADGVKTGEQLMDELYQAAQSTINGLFWLNKRRIFLDTPYGSFNARAIGTAVIEFYGTHNVLDAMTEETWFAFKLTSSGSRIFRRKTTIDGSGNITADKFENWSNSPLANSYTFRLLLI